MLLENQYYRIKPTLLRKATIITLGVAAAGSLMISENKWRKCVRGVAAGDAHSAVKFAWKLHDDILAFSRSGEDFSIHMEQLLGDDWARSERITSLFQRIHRPFLPEDASLSDRCAAYTAYWAHHSLSTRRMQMFLRVFYQKKLEDAGAKPADIDVFLTHASRGLVLEDRWKPMFLAILLIQATSGMTCMLLGPVRRTILRWRFGGFTLLSVMTVTTAVRVVNEGLYRYLFYTYPEQIEDKDALADAWRQIQSPEWRLQDTRKDMAELKEEYDELSRFVVE